MGHFFILILIGISLCIAVWSIRRDTPPVWSFAPAVQLKPGGASRMETVFDYIPAAGQAHAPALVLTDQGFEVLWFQGSQEAQADVDIHHAVFVDDAGQWREMGRGLKLTRAGLSTRMDPRQLVLSLGNTVENQHARGIFATVLSVGGWAMASVVHIPDGVEPARKLNLSPVLGRSNLVKSPMLRFADGSYGLPAYFEMGATYGLLARFDAAGRVRDTVRMAGAGKPIQPMIVPLDQKRAVAFLRDFDPSGRLLICRTEDGGAHWSRVKATDLPNPSAPVAAHILGDGRILMVANDDPDGGDRLSLLISEDEGESWTALRVLEENGVGARYPMLRLTKSGAFLLCYSFGNKAGIRVRSFNAAWVDSL